ncbi:MAG: glycosyltransferase family 4 protein [Patescibacteria group bacterium]
MKIAHVVSTFSPHVGGMGSVCYNEAKRLAELGHDVTVFTLRYPGVVYNDTKFLFKVVRLKPLIRLGDAGLVPQILNYLKGFNLIHLHYPFYGGAEWLCFSGIPLVITYHMDAQVGGAKGFVAKIYDWFWPKILFAQAKKIIAVDAEHFKNTKFGKLYSGKVVEIHNGVDTVVFNPYPVDLEKLDLTGLKDRKIILFVGNLLPLKRLDLLINAVKLLDDKNVVIVVVGGGYELEKYKEMVKDLNIESQVCFVGPCADPIKLVQYYNAASCVVVLSDYESFSLVAIEAMACGKPLVLSDLPVLKKNISEAIFFEKGSVESLKNALEKALSLSEEEKKKIAEREIQKVNQGFSWSNHINKLIEVYERI